MSTFRYNEITGRSFSLRYLFDCSVYIVEFTCNNYKWSFSLKTKPFRKSKRKKIPSEGRYNIERAVMN